MIDIKLTGLKELQEALASLPEDLADAGVERANVYILNYEQMYPLVNLGGPFTWTSEKQRRAFFASNGFGHGIPYRRSLGLRKGWKTEGHGRTQTVVNAVPYARFVKGEQQQIGFKKDRGWTKTSEDIAARIGKIVEAFNKGVREALRKKKLG